MNGRAGFPDPDGSTPNGPSALLSPFNRRYNGFEIGIVLLLVLPKRTGGRHGQAWSCPQPSRQCPASTRGHRGPCPAQCCPTPTGSHSLTRTRTRPQPHSPPTLNPSQPSPNDCRGRCC